VPYGSLKTTGYKERNNNKMSNEEENHAGRRYILRPMTGFESNPTTADILFEDKVIRTYKYYLKDDLLGKLESADGNLRLGILKDVPEASEIVRSAEEKAYDVYDEMVAGILQDLDKERKKLKERQDSLAGAVNAQDPISEERDRFDTVKLMMWDTYVEEYREFGRRYCFGLKYCYPMYALHHVNPVMRVDVQPQSRRFHCPCGKGGTYWRKVRCGMMKYTGSVHEKDNKNHPDFCGVGQGSYDSIQELMKHLQSRATVFFNYFA
jgi:hypothetical protein